MAVEGIYGAIAFGKTGGRIHTFYEIEKKYAGRFTAHLVHLRKPLLEWAGNDILKIDMKVKINAAWSGDPNAVLAQWHFFHENALAAPLVIGDKPMGPGLSLFVITEMNETHKQWLSKGRLLACELAISFQEYIAFSEGLFSMFGFPGFGGSFLGSGSL